MTRFALVLACLLATPALAQEAVTAAASEDPQQTYDESYVWFQDWVGVDAQSGVVVSEWTQIFKGKYKERLTFEEFLDYIGRKDLADDYRSRLRKRRIRAAIGGGVMLAGGTALTVWGATRSSEDCQEMAVGSSARDDCFQAYRRRGGWGIGGGTVLLLTSLLGAAVGAMTVDPFPITAPEGRKLAEQFNKKLARELGLPPTSRRKTRLVPRLHADLFVGPDGAGAALTVRF